MNQPNFTSSHLSVDPQPRRGVARRLALVAACAAVAFASVGCGGGGSSGGNGSTAQQMQATVNKALWVANGANVVEFLPSQLGAGSSDPAPHLSINSAAFGAPQGVTFDAQGNLWVIDGGTVAAGGTVAPALYEFSAAQLAALDTMNAPTPNLTIHTTAFTFPQQAVFDAAGNLWVSDNGSNAVFVFTPAQLAAGAGTTAASITITSNPAFQGPLGIAFDAGGDLFIANNASTTIYKFNSNVLPTAPGSYTLTPSVTLADDGQGSIQAPWALVFDADGNLWSSNANTPNTVVEFPANVLSVNGAPVPAVTLSPVTTAAGSTLSAPNGLAFDNLGDLAAISSATPFGVADFAKAQLVATLTGPTPDTFLAGPTTTLNAPAGAVFGPAVN